LTELRPVTRTQCWRSGNWRQVKLCHILLKPRSHIAIWRRVSTGSEIYGSAGNVTSAAAPFRIAAVQRRRGRSRSPAEGARADQISSIG
jgi:hypothetical protein